MRRFCPVDTEGGQIDAAGNGPGSRLPMESDRPRGAAMDYLAVVEKVTRETP